MELILFGLLLSFYFALHSILADNKVKAFLMSKWIDKKYYRLMFNFLSIILLLPIYWCYQRTSATLLFEYSLLHNIGIGLILLGGLLFKRVHKESNYKK